MKTLGNNNKEMLKIKNTVTEMKNAFDELINTLDTRKVSLKRVNKHLQNSPVKRNKKEMLKTDYAKTKTITDGVTYT